MSLLPVILAGGSGTRLWPASRKLMPKQFLKLTSHHSMLIETINRLSGLESQSPIILCNEEHRFIAAEELRTNNIHDAKIILEPVGRDTAPAITLAALAAKPDDILLVLAADHLIQNIDVFHPAIKSAVFHVNEGKLITFGIVPTEPHTGYGYIKAQSKNEISSVLAFYEKPDLDMARHYVECGDYFWNSGMFMFKAKHFLAELEKHSPEILSTCSEAMHRFESDMDFIRPNHQRFMDCPSDSIDYALMEKTQNAMVVPLNAGWNDIGSWNSLWEISDKDDAGNVVLGDVLTQESKNCFIHANEKLIATIGLENTIVVDTKDALLISSKDKIQNVKQIVNQLKTTKRSEFLHDREVYRPWGKYDSINLGKRDKVKRITVKPGAKISSQMHHHRAEHWIVVSGTAKVSCGEETYLVSENESTYIPLGQIHSLENPGKIELELIEVQTGSYLEEDDIVRFKESISDKNFS